MKKLFLALTFVFASTAAFAQIPMQNLKAWYKLNGDASDSSGNGNHGTNSGATPTVDRFGKVGKAMNFNGSAKISIPTPNFTWSQDSAFTLSMWIKADSNLAGVAFFVGNGTGGNFVTLFQTGTTGNINFGVTRQGSAWQRANGTLPNFYQWHHIVGVYNGGSVKLFVDGTQVGTATYSMTSTAVIQPIYIGSDFATAYFEGDIDDVALYSGELTQQQITSIYTYVPIVNPLLTNLTVNTGTLTPAFNSSVSSYSVYLPGATTHIQFTPTSINGLPIGINATQITSGQMSAPLALNAGNNLFTITVYASATNTKSYQVNVTRAVATQNLSASSTSIYPNPSSDIFNLKTDEKTVWTLYDVNGKRMASGISYGGTTPISTEGFNNGVYILKTDNGSVFRLVKQ